MGSQRTAGERGPHASPYCRGSDLPVPSVGGGGSAIGDVLQTGRLRGMSTLDSRVLGASYGEVNGLDDGGSVWMIHPDANGLSLVGVERWVQIAGMALEPLRPFDRRDRVGDSLAIGDFNGDNVRDPAVGANDRNDPEEHSGAVQFLDPSEFIPKNPFD